MIVTAAGPLGMPSDAEERVGNARRMIDARPRRGIPPDRLFVDPLVFPISVDGEFGEHCLDAIAAISADATAPSSTSPGA